MIPGIICGAFVLTARRRSRVPASLADGAMPAANSADATDRERLSIRAVRPRNVERPSPIAGYFTSCGNIHDGVLAYRLAGLPLTLQRLIEGQSSDTSTWEMRHELSYVRLLLRFPFTMAASLLGGALWWLRGGSSATSAALSRWRSTAFHRRSWRQAHSRTPRSPQHWASSQPSTRRLVLRTPCRGRGASGGA